MSDRGRVGLLISGRGSNMVSLVEAMQRGAIDAEPAVVFSNVPDAPGLARAAEMGVSTEALSTGSSAPSRPTRCTGLSNASTRRAARSQARSIGSTARTSVTDSG